jgi:pimeloyl-ACP methyl ester carboxylesterase
LAGELSKPNSPAMTEQLQLRVHHEGTEPTLIYLPGLHGDWTLVPAFRQALGSHACLAEFTYPRREDWPLDEYARAVTTRLVERGLTRGWLIGESFSSQVAWAILQLAIAERKPDAAPLGFEPQGLILAGGFVRHPVRLGVRCAALTSRHIPMRMLKALCQVWAKMAERRNRSSAEVVAGIREFVGRRANISDRLALNRRYQLITENDLRPVARQAMLPVFFLSGLMDPIVPWPPVRSWLQKNCPGYRGSRIVRRAGHNVLLDAPFACAEQILDWIAETMEAAVPPHRVTSSTPNAG